MVVVAQLQFLAWTYFYVAIVISSDDSILNSTRCITIISWDSYKDTTNNCKIMWARLCVVGHSMEVPIQYIPHFTLVSIVTGWL